MSAPRIYDPKVLTQIAECYKAVSELIEKLDPEGPTDAESPLYIFSLEIVLRHQDGYTIGRIGMDDFPFFEITDETYGEKTS